MGYAPAFCLALLLAPGAVRPKPVRPVVLKADPAVPAAGAAAERLDSVTGRGRSVGSLLESRADFQATPVPDGRVLITGGSAKATSEWFDPATDRFTSGPPLTRARQGHRAVALKDGRILLLGGTEAPAQAEVLDPGGTAFRAVPDARFGLSADAVELDDGKVLLVDGASGALYTWDGKKSPAARGSLARPRNFFRLVRLKDGRVAVTGGWPSEQKAKGRRGASGPGLPLECFNPRWSSLSTWSQTPAPRARHQAALLADGRICLWAGVGLDPDVAVAGMEIVDPAKETVTPAGTLDLGGDPSPAWAVDAAGKGLHLPERGRRILVCDGPLDLPKAQPAGRLANGYLGPILVPLPKGGVLVLGAPAYGDPIDRWDPRARQTAVVGALRQGVRHVGLLPDGKLLAVGDVVDLLDPRTGALTPLGWAEDLGALLATQRPAVPAPPGPPGSLVVALDKGRALVVGGGTPEEPSGSVDILDLKKKTLTRAGTMKIRRARPEGLKLNDGTVLVWGPGKE